MLVEMKASCKCMDCGSILIELRPFHTDYGKCLTCDSVQIEVIKEDKIYA